MSERFPDKVLREAIEAYESHEDYRAVEAMRAVLEGHETDRVVALERMIERLRGALDLCGTDEEGWPEIECADAYEASRVLVPERPCDSADCQLSGPHTLTEVCYPPKALCRCGCTFEQHDDPTQFRPAISTGAAS